MERLDACYFCGTAADAPLREVTISPRESRGDPDAAVRVTLCPSCEDKLQRVLGGLFDHVESRAADAERAGAAAGRAGPTGDGPAEARPTGGREAGGEDPDAAATAADEAARARVDRIDVGSPEDEVDAGQEDERLFAEPPSVGDVEPDDARDDEAADREASGGASGRGDEVTGPGDEEDAEIVDEEPRVRARATSGGPDGLDGVSVAEYNRVMRLLQNREFPMDRTAFVDLAGSAYDLGEDTVQAVLDAVIDQGALAEREGSLVRPDEGDGP